MYVRRTNEKEVEKPSALNCCIGSWLIVPGNSKTKLAHELGLSRPSVTARLKDNRLFTWYEVLKIQELTGASLDSLADGALPDVINAYLR